MLRGYEANSRETSRTIAPCHPRTARPSAAAGALLVLHACTSTTSPPTRRARDSTLPASSTDARPRTTGPRRQRRRRPALDHLRVAAQPATENPPPTTGAADPAVAAPIPGEPGTSIDWERIDEDFDRGTLLVPVDYSDPSLGNFRLFLVRRRANDQEDKIGSLLINPGGPGASGASSRRGADFKFGTELLDRFDVIGWDPRGTYDTDAGDRLHRRLRRVPDRLDITPDSPEADSTASTWPRSSRTCASRRTGRSSSTSAPTTRRATWTRSAGALGEDKISYFGFSYGSELGATWATLFPDTVRAAVLDGAKDPNAGSLEWDRQQRVGFEHTLDAVPRRLRGGQRLRLPQRGVHPRGVRRGDGATSTPTRSRPRPAAPTSPAAWRCRPWRWRCTTTPSGTSCPTPSPMPSRATVTGC